MMSEDLPAGAQLLAEKLRAALPDGEGIVRLSDVAPEGMSDKTVRRHLRRLRDAGALTTAARGRSGVHISLRDRVSASDHISPPSDHISDHQDHHEPEESRTIMAKPMPLNRQARRAHSRQRAAQVKAFYAEAAPLIGKVFPDGPPTLDGLPKITPDLLAAMTRAELATLWAVTSWAQVGHDDSRAVCDAWTVPHNPVIDFLWHDPLYEALSVAGVSYAATTADDLLPYWRVAS